MTAHSPLQIVAEAVGVVAAGAVLGLVVNTVSPRPVALGRPVLPTSAEGACEMHGEAARPARIALDEAKSACLACTAAFVDARSEESFAEGHVIGAMHRPEHGHPDEAAQVQRLREYPTVIVYDDDVGCRLAEGVARHLTEEGLPDVRVLDGNWSAWEAAGGPAQSGACEVCSQPSAQTARREHP